MLNRVLKLYLSILVFSVVILSPYGMQTANAASVNYDVTGGQLTFDTETGTITSFIGNPTLIVIPSRIKV